MGIITDIADLRRQARKRLPAIIFDYVENGGYQQETLRRNRLDIESVAMIPRALNDVSVRNLKTTLVGQEVSFPLALAPVGACGLTYPNAEVEAAKAAKKAGIPFCLSTLSIATIEDVAEATHAPFWFQLYLMKDHGVGNALVQRALDAGVSAMALSMDLHMRSRRHPEKRRGLQAPPRITVANVCDVIWHLDWLASMRHSKRRTFGNLIGLAPDAKNVANVTRWLEEQFDPTLSTKTIEWLRDLWPRKLIVKGIMAPQDARRCAELGADAVIVSNHGGRQVDGVVSTISILPAVVEAVGGRCQVLVDSGIRSGVDMLKMIARGADGCLVGRPYLYGLAYAGEAGVAKVIDILMGELDETLALCGQTDIEHLPDDLLAEDRLTPGGAGFETYGARTSLV